MPKYLIKMVIYNGQIGKFMLQFILCVTYYVKIFQFKGMNKMKIMRALFLTILFMLLCSNLALGSTTSTNINVNTVYSGSIASSSQSNVYKFTLADPGKISINFKHDLLNDSSRYWDISILDANNNENYSFSSYGNTINLDSTNIYLPSGTYSMKVSPYSFNNSTFQFILNYTKSTGFYEKEFNDSMNTANDVLLNKQYTGALQSSNDKDFYKFTLATDGKISVNFNHELLSDSYRYWDISFVDANNYEYYSFSSYGNNVTLDSNNIFIPAGTYYLKVNPYSSIRADYSFKLNYTINNGSFEKEFNDSMKTANDIQLNTSYTGALQSSNDKDFYKFTLATDGKVSLNFKHELLPDNYRYWDISIIDVNNYQHYSVSSYGNNPNMDTYNMFLPSGTYYIIVNAYSLCKNDYTFELFYTQNDGFFEKEFNNNITNANDIALNSYYTGALQFSSDDDFYKFTVTKSEKLTLNFQHTLLDSAKWEVTIIDANNKQYFNGYSNAGDTNKDIMTAISFLPGEYYIKIEAYSHSYADYKFNLKSDTTLPTSNSKNYTVSKINFTNMAGTPVTQLTPGSFVFANLNVTANDTLSLSPIILVAVYDSNHKLIQCNAVTVKFTNGDTKEVLIGFNLPSNLSGVTIKAFAWDTIIGQTALSNNCILYP